MIAVRIDITSEVCPMTFVRTRIALDRLLPGDELSVLLAGEEPWLNVVGNAVALGHEVLSDRPEGGEGCRLIVIRKAMAPAREVAIRRT